MATTDESKTGTRCPSAAARLRALADALAADNDVE